MGSVYLVLGAALLVYISPIIDGAATGDDELVKATNAFKNTDSQIRARQLSPIEAYLPSDKGSDKQASLSTSQASSVTTNNINSNEATDLQSSGRNLYYPASYAQSSYQQPQPQQPQQPQQAYQPPSFQPKQQVGTYKQVYHTTAYNYGSPKQPAAPAYGNKGSAYLSHPNSKAQVAADSYKSPRPLIAQPAGYGQHKNPAKYKAILRQKGYPKHAADEIIEDIESYNSDVGHSTGNHHKAPKVERPYKHAEYLEYPGEYQVPEHHEHHKHHHNKHPKVVIKLPEPEKHHKHHDHKHLEVVVEPEKHHHPKHHHHDLHDLHHHSDHHALKGKVHVNLVVDPKASKPKKKVAEVVELLNPEVKRVKDGENEPKIVIKFNGAQTAIEPLPPKVFRPDNLGEPNLLSNLQNGLQRVKVKLHEQQVGRIDFDALRQIRQILRESLLSAKILLEELDDLLDREGEVPGAEEPQSPDLHKQHHKHHQLLDEVGLVPNGVPVTEFTKIIEGEYDDNSHDEEEDLEDAFEDEPEETSHHNGSSARGLSGVAGIEPDEQAKQQEGRLEPQAAESPVEEKEGENKARTEEKKKTEKEEALSHIEAPSPLSLHMPGGGTLVPDMNDWSKSLSKAINKSAKSDANKKVEAVQQEASQSQAKAAKSGDFEPASTVSTPDNSASNDYKTASAATTKEGVSDEQKKEFGLPSGEPSKNFKQPLIKKHRPTNKIVDEIGSLGDNSLIMMGDSLTPVQLMVDGLKANIDRIANDLKDGKLAGTNLRPSMILRAAERKAILGRLEKANAAKLDKKKAKKFGAAKKAELEEAIEEKKKAIEELEKKADFEIKDKADFQAAQKADFDVNMAKLKNFLEQNNLVHQ